jgi:type I restriction enzyme, S subunit
MEVMEESATHLPGEGFKRTEVGVIPTDWEVKPLHSLAEKITVGIANAATHAYRDRGVVMFRNQNIKPNHLDDRDVLYIDELFEQQYRNKRLRAGDLLTARTGYPGTTSIVPAGYEGAQTFTTLITRPRKALINPHYLCFFINSDAGQRYIEQSQAGGGQKNVNAGSLKFLSIALPPTMTEQEAIAEALSDVDALSETLEQLLAKKHQLRQGAMKELLTATKRLQGFSGAWQVKRLRDLADIQRGASPRPIDSTIWFDENSSVGWVRISDVTNSGMYLHHTTQRLSPLGVQNSRPVRLGSLIMSICATVGRPIITEIATCIHDGFVAFDNVRADKQFLYYILKSIEADWSRHGQTGSQMNLNTGLINRTEVSVPPTLPEQTAIAAVLSDMDVEIDALEAKLVKVRCLKQGMTQQLLTGRIRLI